jgi:hypothetical protein
MTAMRISLSGCFIMDSHFEGQFVREIPGKSVMHFPSFSCGRRTVDATCDRGEILQGFIPPAAALALIHLCDLIALPFTSITLDPFLWIRSILLALVLIGLGLRCLALMTSPVVGASMIIFALTLLAGSSGLLLSYVTASLGRYLAQWQSSPRGIATWDLTGLRC